MERTFVVFNDWMLFFSFFLGILQTVIVTEPEDKKEEESETIYFV